MNINQPKPVTELGCRNSAFGKTDVNWPIFNEVWWLEDVVLVILAVVVVVNCRHVRWCWVSGSFLVF